LGFLQLWGGAKIQGFKKKREGGKGKKEGRKRAWLIGGGGRRRINGQFAIAHENVLLTKTRAGIIFLGREMAHGKRRGRRRLTRGGGKALENSFSSSRVSAIF